MSKALTYEELIQLALENYNNGGDCVYECWERTEFDSYVKEFGPITKKVAMSLFRLYATTYEER